MLKCSNSNLRFSIIIPLEFHRGQMLSCIKRWACEQTYPRNNYEIIVVGCSTSIDSELSEQIQCLLNQNDKFFFYDTPHDIALIAYAALQARGEVLFFTESHCLAEENTLELVEEKLKSNPEWAGFSCRSCRVTHNALSIVEADIYEADIQYGMEKHAWRKILDQCFVVWAKTYHDSGGFKPELGHFAEWHLSAKMHQKGFCIGYAPEIKISHYYIGNAKDLREFTADFSRGEMIYHAQFFDDPCKEYFQAPAEWPIRYYWIHAKKCFLLVWKAKPSKGIIKFFQLSRIKMLLHWGARALIDLKLICFKAYFYYQVQRCRLYLASRLKVKSSLLHEILVEFMNATACLERYYFIKDWLHKETQLGRTCTQRFNLVGFHVIEKWNGYFFRWTEPVAMMEIFLKEGIYHFNLAWLPIIHSVDELAFYLDENHLSFSQEACRAYGDFFVDSARLIRFSLTCKQQLSRIDSRLLGLSISSMSIWRADGVCQIYTQKMVFCEGANTDVSDKAVSNVLF